MDFIFPWHEMKLIEFWHLTENLKQPNSISAVFCPNINAAGKLNTGLHLPPTNFIEIKIGSESSVVLVLVGDNHIHFVMLQY